MYHKSVLVCLRAAVVSVVLVVACLYLRLYLCELQSLNNGLAVHKLLLDQTSDCFNDLAMLGAQLPLAVQRQLRAKTGVAASVHRSQFP